MTIACAILFAILCGLGVWQLQRLQWKLALIATVNGHMTAAPVTLDQIAAMPPDEAQYRRVTLHGRFDHAKEAYVFTTDATGAPVYHVLTPFLTDDGRTLMVDRGAVPKEKLDPASRAAGNVAGETAGDRRVARARCAGPVHAARPIRRIASGMPATWPASPRPTTSRCAAPVVIEADATPNPGGCPKAARPW